MASTRGKWVPLASVAVAAIGFVAALLGMGLVATPEYEHASYLHTGLIWLAWSWLALASVAVSAASLRRSFAQLSRAVRRITVVLDAVVLIVAAGALPLSIASLNIYRAGIAAYDAAVQSCGHPPVLATTGFGDDVILPTDSDYERLKYSTTDPLLGTTTYFCTLAEAEANGHQRQVWHDQATCPAHCPVADVFASPVPYPGRPWHRGSAAVPPSEMAAAAGPAHCGWQSATFLTFGWPLGTRPQTAAGARQFIRDPDRIVPSLRPMDPHATLPPDARPTGYTYGSIALYLSPSDQDQYVYLVGSTVERWPRSDPMSLCQ